MKIKSVFIFFILIFNNLDLYCSVEHKEEYIDKYLSNISSSMDEKTQILEHILKNPSGYFVDIGTGGDAIAVVAKRLPKNSRPTLIAADIDPHVIKSIKERRPEIHEYLDKSLGPKVELLTMSAVNMKPLLDNSIAGIGASALTHEVFSYEPSKSSLDQFTSEVCRVLEKDGVFIYRDPKWVDDPNTQCIMTLHSELCKYYSTLFLTKFLDRRHSLITNYRGECCKPNLYSPNQIRLTVFLKSLQSSIQLSFSEFLKTPVWEIDYRKSFSIEAPKGLLAEIQRHYIMYLRDYCAIGLLDPSILRSSHRFI